MAGNNIEDLKTWLAGLMTDMKSENKDFIKECMDAGFKRLEDVIKAEFEGVKEELNNQSAENASRALLSENTFKTDVLATTSKILAEVQGGRTTRAASSKTGAGAPSSAVKSAEVVNATKRVGNIMAFTRMLIETDEEFRTRVEEALGEDEVKAIKSTKNYVSKKGETEKLKVFSNACYGKMKNNPKCDELRAEAGTRHEEAKTEAAKSAVPDNLSPEQPAAE